MVETKYNFWIGCWKSIKNNAIILGGAAISHLILTRANWLPEEFGWLDMVIGGFVAYLAKNKFQFK